MLAALVSLCLLLAVDARGRRYNTKSKIVPGAINVHLM
jgi:hypothetical protein